MKIGILGTGKMGSGLGKLWAAKGHEVMFGSRDPAKAGEQASEIPNVKGGSIHEATAYGQVLLLAVPWHAAIETVKKMGPLNDKILIDLTNPLAEKMRLAIGHTTSAAEEICQVAHGAQVVKAFNGIHFSLLANQTFNGIRPDVFYCGGNDEAKATVAQLIKDAGFDGVDAGPLENARLLEALANLWMQLAFTEAMGTNIAFKLLRR